MCLKSLTSCCACYRSERVISPRPKGAKTHQTVSKSPAARKRNPYSQYQANHPAAGDPDGNNVQCVADVHCEWSSDEPRPKTSTLRGTPSKHHQPSPTKPTPSKHHQPSQTKQHSPTGPHQSPRKQQSPAKYHSPRKPTPTKHHLPAKPTPTERHSPRKHHSPTKQLPRDKTSTPTKQVISQSTPTKQQPVISRSTPTKLPPAPKRSSPTGSRSPAKHNRGSNTERKRKAPEPTTSKYFRKSGGTASEDGDDDDSEAETTTTSTTAAAISPQKVRQENTIRRTCFSNSLHCKVGLLGRATHSDFSLTIIFTFTTNDAFTRCDCESQLDKMLQYPQNSTQCFCFVRVAHTPAFIGCTCS